jgi:predicted CoA-binding protein
MDDQICRLLHQCRTVAVVGLSPKPERDSHRAARFLQERGYRVIPVNPGQTEILGETCYPSLSEIPEPVEIVDVFRRAEAIPPIAEEAMRIGAKVFWMQLGIRHEEAGEKLRRHPMTVIMDRCIKIEQMRCAEESRKDG